jgi:glycosyltransferase involved in cell wall biosynthesis
VSTVDISVVIPTRNRWALLSRRALRGASFQEGVSHEVVVVDDGSTDETPEGLRALADERVRVIRNEMPGGAAQARNIGLHAARGTYVAFLDDDDFWAPEKLRLQLEAVQATRADFAYAGVATLDERGVVLHISAPPDPSILRVDVIERGAIPAGSSNVFARSDLIREIGGFDESFRNMEDWDLWIRLAWAGKAAAVPDVVVACVEHRGGKAVVRPRDAFVPFDALQRKYAALCAEHDVAFDRVAFSHYVAWLQLRRRRHASAARVYLDSALRNRRPRDIIPAARFALRALLPVERSLRSAASPPTAKPSWLELYS